MRQALDAATPTCTASRRPASARCVTRSKRGGIDRVVVVSRDDAFVLRVALMVRNLDDDVPLLVTIFDPRWPTQVREERSSTARCTSMADIVAPSLAGPCLGEDLAAVREDADPPVGMRETDDARRCRSTCRRRRRFAALARAVLTPYDKSAALLLWGALGLVVILLMETAACMAVLGQGLVDASYGAAKTLVTVDPTTRSPTARRG